MHRKQGLFLSMYVDDIKKQNLNPLWKKLMKLVDLGEPTSFLDHVCFRCTQRKCKSNQGATEQLPGWEESHANKIAWSYDMEGHAKNRVERYCELANKTVEQLYKVSTPCLDDHHFKKGRIGNDGRSVNSLLSNRPKMFVFGSKIGRTDILWSVKKLARAVTKWTTRACDRRFARISYIRNANDHRQYCHVGNAEQHCRLGLFQVSDFVGRP